MPRRPTRPSPLTIASLQFLPDGAHVVPIEPFSDEGAGPIERPLKPKTTTPRTGNADQAADRMADPPVQRAVAHPDQQ